MKTSLRLVLFGCLFHPFASSAQSYCTPTYAFGSSVGDYINGFSVGDISNLGSGPSDSTGYTDYRYAGPGFITTLVPATNNAVTFTAGTFDPPDNTGEFYTIWVDVDQSGSLEPNEKLATGTTAHAGEAVTVNLLIPPTAPSGYTLMRVMCVYNTNPMDACGSYFYGETEDYTVVIDRGSPCIPVFSYQGSLGDFVGAVSLADLQWTIPSPPVWGYQDATVLGAHLASGQTSQLVVTKGPYEGADNVYVWIDWGNDGFSSLDLVGSQTAVGVGGTVTFNITPPDLVGYARMRITCCYDDLGNGDGCGAGNYGTTMDFTLAVNHVGWPCQPLLGYGTQLGDAIDSVLFQGYVYQGEQDFPYSLGTTSNEHRLVAGASEAMGIFSGAYAPERYTVAMDMNDDGDFSDADEILDAIESTTPEEILLLDFAVPASCQPGQHVLRIRSTNAAFPLTDPCDDSVFGSMLDIVVVVEGPTGPCIPFLNLWTLPGTFIDGVQLGGIQNTGNGSAWGPAYHEFTLSTDLFIGQADTLVITSGAAGGYAYNAWIDYNGDNDFVDANESLGSVALAAPYTPGQLTFTVPNNALLGPKRLRVRCSPTDISDACLAVTFGETEDYTVNIQTDAGIDVAATSSFRVMSTTDGVQVLSDATWLGSTCTLFDATGRTLTSTRITSDRTDLPMLPFTRGAYIVQMSKDDAREARRFVW